MKTLFTLLAFAAVAVFASACASKTTTHSATTSSTVGYSK